MKNQDEVQPTSDFKGASVQKPRLGYNGEISDAIERCLSVPVVTELHTKNMGFSNISVHEALHICLGLLWETHPHLIEGKNYQADTWAESYVEAMEDYIINPEYDRAKFIDRAQAEANEYGANENMGRVLSWLMSKFFGETVFHYKKKSIHALKMQAEGIDIGWELLNEDKDNYEKEGGIFKISSKRHGEFITARSSIVFPPDFMVKEQIVPFVVPSVEEAGKIFDALEPVLILLRKKLRNDVTIHIDRLSDITTGQLIECIRKGIVPEPENNIDRGFRADI